MGDGGENCVMCKRRLVDNEDALGIVAGVAKEGDGFHGADVHERIICDDCSPKIEGMINHHEELTKFFKGLAKDTSMQDSVAQIAYELNIDLGRY